MGGLGGGAGTVAAAVVAVALSLSGPAAAVTLDAFTVGHPDPDAPPFAELAQTLETVGVSELDSPVVSERRGAQGRPGDATPQSGINLAAEGDDSGRLFAQDGAPPAGTASGMDATAAAATTGDVFLRAGPDGYRAGAFDDLVDAAARADLRPPASASTPSAPWLAWSGLPLPAIATLAVAAIGWLLLRRRRR